MGARCCALDAAPEISLAEIEERLEAVAALKTRTVAREEIRKDLEGILELERLTSRITLGNRHAAGFAGVAGIAGKDSRRCGLADTGGMSVAGRLAKPGVWKRCASRLEELADIRGEVSQAIADDPPALPNNPGVIRPGFTPSWTSCATHRSRAGRSSPPMRIASASGPASASLKIRYNQVFGYYIEVSKAESALVPADYERKQTLVNAERLLPAS